MTRNEKTIPRQATMQDVADLAGVSPSTVSRVLRGTQISLISESTQNRVREAAEKLNYSPNPIARALRKKHTNLLGLIVREVSDPFFSNFISVLNDKAREQGYNIVLGHAHSDPAEALKFTDILDTRHCDGLIIVGDLHNDEAVLQEKLKDRTAAVALCRGEMPIGIPTVTSDNSYGVDLLFNHLFDLGHRRFGFIDGGWLGDVRERRKAFERLVEEKQLENHPQWIQTEDHSCDGGYIAMQKILKFSPVPSAIIAADDEMAIGAMKAIIDQGLKVPEEISIVGFDDIEWSRFVSPALTTVRQSVPLMSEIALQMLLSVINGDLQEPNFIRVKPELIVRQSTGPVKT